MRVDFAELANGHSAHISYDLKDLRKALDRGRNYLATQFPSSEAVTGLAPPCVDGVAPPGTDTSLGGVMPSEPRMLMMPPFGSSPRQATTVRVHMRISPTGGVDSVVVTGDPKAASTSNDAARAARVYRFHPAMFGGCAIESWYTLEMTRGGR